jgi:hypothetical protein
MNHNFNCDNNNTYGTVDCYRKNQCSDIHKEMPPFILRLSAENGTEINKNITILPEAYLIDSPTSDICLSLFKTNLENFSMLTDIVLGAPFFRSYGIVLGYKNVEISIYDGNKTEESPVPTPAPAPTPEFKQLVLNQTLKSNDLLAGEIFVGTPS